MADVFCVNDLLEDRRTFCGRDAPDGESLFKTIGRALFTVESGVVLDSSKGPLRICPNCADAISRRFLAAAYRPEGTG